MKCGGHPGAAIFLVLIILCVGGCRTSHDIIRVSDGSTVDIAQVLDDLKTVPVVFVGETHDDQSHHDVQLEIIRALRDSGVKVAVGLEMFRMDAQGALDQWVAGELTEAAFKKIYYDNWNFPWELYRNIFFYARDHGIPMHGLNIARDITRQVAQRGFDSLHHGQLSDLPEVRCEVDQAYENFIRRAFGMRGHAEMNFTYFCEAQLLWDTVMAWNVVRFLHNHPYYTVVIMAGSGHAWKPGIPAQVQRQSAIPFRVILPEMPGRITRQKVSIEDADYVWADS